MSANKTISADLNFSKLRSEEKLSGPNIAPHDFNHLTPFITLNFMFGVTLGYYNTEYRSFKLADDSFGKLSNILSMVV